MKKTTDLFVDVLAAIDLPQSEPLSEEHPLLECVRSAWNGLTYREREVLKLYNGIVNGRRYKPCEIGHIFGISTAYAKLLIRDAQDAFVFAIKASKPTAAATNALKERRHKK